MTYDRTATVHNTFILGWLELFTWTLLLLLPLPKVELWNGQLKLTARNDVRQTLRSSSLQDFGHTISFRAKRSSAAMQPFGAIFVLNLAHFESNSDLALTIYFRRLLWRTRYGSLSCDAHDENSLFDQLIGISSSTQKSCYPKVKLNKFGIELKSCSRFFDISRDRDTLWSFRWSADFPRLRMRISCSIPTLTEDEWKLIARPLNIDSIGAVTRVDPQSQLSH